MDRILRWPENALNLIAALATMFLVLIGVYQIVVGMRDLCTFGEDPVCVPLINKPMFGYIDMIELAMPILAIIGIAYCMRMGTHIRMDLLIARLRGRVLWTLETIAALVTLLPGGAAGALLLRLLLRRLQSGRLDHRCGAPTWPSKLLVPIAFWLLCGTRASSSSWARCA